MKRASQSRHSSGFAGAWRSFALVFAVLYAAGYMFGFFSKDLVFSERHKATSREIRVEVESPVTTTTTISPPPPAPPPPPQWAGDSIHSVITSSGDHYQNFQARIMYATYKLMQKMPGGERHTGFTRLLHRTVPDLLMDEIPTHHVLPLKPQCDGWCDYPVANRPPAIKQFFDDVKKNESMIQGAWVFMLECDYVWMQPMKVPGSAYDPSVPGVQFFYDYIMPQHPNAVPWMQKLLPGGNVSDIPASGPSPVLLRLKDWHTIVDDYAKASAVMEADEMMKKKLEWVREMYAYDAAVAKYKDTIKIRTEHPGASTTIVQPPFDEGLFDACLCHYTWGALYHEGLPSKGAKQVYRWEKRDFNDLKFVLKVPNIPMPPPYQDGWILEFDAPLNRKRHDLVVLMLTQMNKGIDTLPDLTEHWKKFEPELNKMMAERDAKVAAQAAAKAEAAKAAKPTRKLMSVDSGLMEP